MSLVNGLLKFYAYVYHLVLSTALLCLGILATKTHSSLHLGMLPFNQERLVSRISLMAIVGFICIFLALVKIFEIVLPLWSIALLVLFTWGFFFTSYSFHGPISLGGAMLLLLATLLAVYGSIMVLMPQRRNRW